MVGAKSRTNSGTFGVEAKGAGVATKKKSGAATGVGNIKSWTTGTSMKEKAK